MIFWKLHFLNLIYDLRCTAIPWNKIDEEFLAVPPSVFATWGRYVPGSANAHCLFWWFRQAQPPPQTTAPPPCTSLTGKLIPFIYYIDLY